MKRILILLAVSSHAWADDLEEMENSFPTVKQLPFDPTSEPISRKRGPRKLAISKPTLGAMESPPTLKRNRIKLPEPCQTFDLSRAYVTAQTKDRPVVCLPLKTHDCLCKGGPRE